MCGCSKTKVVRTVDPQTGKVSRQIVGRVFRATYADGGTEDFLTEREAMWEVAMRGGSYRSAEVDVPAA